jgi:hypothetical protein
MKDAAGNDATLTFTVPNTSGVLVNAAVPSGYTVAFADRTVTNINKTALSFSLTYPKANKTLNYSIASSGGGAPITGTVTTAAGTTTVNGINATTLSDGKLTLSAYLTDSIGGTGATVTDNIPMAVLDASLVGHWTFDASDVSGITAFDRSGQGNNGTLTNGPIQATGQVGGALNFDGINDFVTRSNPAGFPSGQTARTISLWIKPSLPCSGPVSGVLFHYGNNSGGGQEFIFLRAPNGAPTPCFLFTDGVNVANNQTIVNAEIPLAGQLSYVTFVFDGVNTFAYYLNGTQVKTGAYGITINTAAPTIMNIGVRSDGGLFGFYQGQIDDVRIYNRALTPAEITTLYNATN